MDHQTISDSLEEHARRLPAKAALVSAGTTIPYSLLNGLIKDLSAVVRQSVTGEAPIVATCLKPGQNVVIAMLACLRAEVSCFPLDPVSPKTLPENWADIAMPRLVITDEEHFPSTCDLLKSKDLSPNILLLSHGKAARLFSFVAGEWIKHPLPVTTEMAQQKGADVSYASHFHLSADKKHIIKGNSAALAHFIPWFTNTFGLTESARGIWLHPVTSELAWLEVLATLYAGATLYIPERADTIETQHKALQTHRISWAFLPADTFRQMASYREGVVGLDMVFTGEGTPLTGDVVYKWQQQYGNRTRIIHTLVGPEATMFRAWQDISDASPGQHALSFGQPVEKSFTAILSASGLCKPFEQGDIYIKSPHLSLGYAGEEEAFVQNPLVPQKDLLFRTGLKGYYMADRQVVAGSVPAAAFGVVDAAPGIQVQPPATDYPVSHAQKRLWVLDQVEGGMNAYNMYCGYDMRGDLNISAFRQAFQTVVARHEVLRTTFTTREGEPRQVVHDAEVFDFQVSYQDFSIEENGLALSEEAAQSLVETVFDLEKGPLFSASLFKTADNSYLFVLVMHHIVSDGWSMNVLVKEALMLYDAFCHELPSPLKPLDIQYRDYAAWQREELQKEGAADHKGFWKEIFSEKVPPLDIPADYPRPLKKDYTGGVVSGTIDRQTLQQLHRLAITRGATLFITLQAALDAFLYRYTGQNDLTLISPIAGRPHPELEDQIGFYINMLPLRARFSGEDTFLSLLQQVRDLTFRAYEHQVYPFDKLIDDLKLSSDKGRSPLSEVCMVLQNTSHVNVRTGIAGVAIEARNFSSDMSKYDLTWNFSEDEGELYYTINYASALFRRERIENMVRLFNTLVKAIVTNPAHSIDSLPLLDRPALAQVTETFNPCNRKPPLADTVISLFARKVAATPDKVAVEYEDTTLTYTELDTLSTRLAAELQATYQVEPGHRVAIISDRDHRFIIAVLAVLKAGGVYVPLDPKFPEDRKRFILEDTSAQVVLGPVEYIHEFVHTCPVCILDTVEELPASSHRLDVPLTADDPAYIMYTSGSTGQPKGVIVPHRGIARLVHEPNYVRLSTDSRLLLTGAISFDATTFEIWGMLLNGGTLCLVPEDVLLSPPMLKEAIASKNISIIWLTAGYFNQLADSVPELFAPLKRLLVGGDRLSVSHINRIWRKYPHLTIINGYGPTENTTFSICHPINKAYTHDIPLGRPISRSSVYILDDKLRAVPVGVPGEICVGGEGLALGYLNNEALTAGKFIDHPFIKGRKLYRTGDIGRWTTRGLVEFIGRKDFQVKISGYRIEPGEVEAAFEGIDGLGEKAVLVKENSQGQKYLVAYYAGETIAEDYLKKILRSRLPAHAIPSVFIKMDGLPLNNNGKVDRGQLPEPESVEGKKAIIAPETAMEVSLAAIWQEVLDVPAISREDDFFDIGGQSLKAIQMMTRLHKEMALSVRLSELFSAPVLKDMAAMLEGKGESSGNTIPKADAQPDYALSHAQKRLWLLAQTGENLTAYNMPLAYELRGALNVESLQKAFRTVVERHDSLRTVFLTREDGEPRQQVIGVDGSSVALQVCDLSGEASPTEVARKAITAEVDTVFDLENGPLFRAFLYKVGEETHYLLLNMHHIISDGWSLEVLTKEVFALYRAYSQDLPNPLPVPDIQYTDYSAWHREQMNGEAGEGHKAFWREALSGDLPVLDMPADFVRPAFKTYDGAAVSQRTRPAFLQSLHKLAEQAGATLFTTLSALTKGLLYRYTGQTDIILGTVVAGRSHYQLEDQIGFYVNTLPLRSTFAGSDTVRDFLFQEKEAVLKAFEHQVYPLDKIVEDLAIKPDTSRAPLFDALIVLQNNELKKDVDGLQGIDIKPLSAELTTSKYDLEFNFAENNDGGLNITLTYNTSLYKKSTAERLLHHLITYMEQAGADPASSLSAIDYLSEEERTQVLDSWTHADTEYPAHMSVTGLFAMQVESRPEARALLTPEGSYTYRALDLRTTALASLLVNDYGVQPGDFVGILAKRSVDYITSMLAILKAGAVYVPLDPAFPNIRKHYILEDTGCRVLLMESEYLADWQQSHLQVLDLGNVAYENAGTGGFTACQASPDDLAYIMYTSGSTGNPKGVKITHQGVVRLVMNTNYLSLEPDSRLLMNGAVAFDASTFEVWGMLLNGGSIVLVDNDILMHPDDLKEAMEAYEVNTFWITTGYFNQLAEVEPSVFAPVRQMVTGGERMSLPHVNKIRELYPDLKLSNVYGPTENTTFSLFHPVTEPAVSTDVPLGKPIANSTVYVLDAHLQPVPVGVKGEICVGGDGLATGYLNRDDLTAEKFVPHPGKTDETIYRTGDMGRWNERGEVEFLGRKDFQVKIRGFRVETGEVEAVMETVEGMQDKLVRAFRDTDGVNHLVAYYTGAETLEEDTIRERLRQELPDYMVPTFFMRLGEMPMNTSGKTDLKALPLPAFSGEKTGYVAPATAIEKELAAIWSDVLGIEQIGREDNFFSLGGHSLRATQIVSRVYKQMQTKITLRDMYSHASLQEMAQCIVEKGGQTGYEAIPKAPQADTYPLTHAQKRMWVLEQFDDKGMQAFNMPSAYYLDGDLDIPAFQQSLQAIIRRHETLRTVFVTEDGQPRQKIISAEAFGFPYRYEDLSGLADKEERARTLADAEVSQPFDLSAGPLLRITLLRMSEGRHLLLLTLHHIISDGWSMQVFTRELFEGYNRQVAGKAIADEPLALRYVDYAVWMEQVLSGESLEAHRAFWLEAFDGDLPVLALPTDRPRPKVQTHNGAVEDYFFPADITTRLKALCQEEQASLYMALVSSLNALFYRYSGQTDMIIGSPIAGRQNEALEKIIGLFLNTLPIRSQFRGDMTFSELLATVKKHTLGAFDHQAYPVDLLIEELRIPRDLGRSPLFDVLVVLQNMSAQEADAPMGGLSISGVPQALTASKFDLSFYFSEEDGGLRLALEYNTDLYDQRTVRQITAHLHQLIEAVVETPHQVLYAIDYLGTEEKSHLVKVLAKGDQGFSQDGLIGKGLVEWLASRSESGAVAVRCGDLALSYADLWTMATRVAGAIIQAGVEKGQPVALFVERNERMVAALLGSLMAGTPYVPIDTEYPVERVRTIMQDAGARLVLTDSKTEEALPGALGLPLVRLDSLPQTDEVSRRPVRGDDPAYILYTSGSTGKPKGVVVSHTALSGYVQFAAQYFDLSPSDTVVQQASLSFDTSVEEIFPALLAGSTLVIAPEGGRNTEALQALIQTHEATVLSTTPLVINELNKAPDILSGLRVLISGGDRLREAHIDVLPDTLRLYNTYGPTEATVCATYHLVTDRRQTDIIGKPVAGKRIYILDEHGRPQPVGVPGELCIAGEGLATGYLNRPEQTAAAFVPDPFMPGARMYRTGDTARWTAEGTIRFEGRQDDQVKIRGHRVEPSETEAVLSRHPAVKEAAVLISADGKVPALLAFTSVTGDTQEQTLRAYLLAHLPPYMLPSRIHILDELPRNTAGKADRKALLQWSRQQAEGFKAFVGPRTPHEEQVAAIWQTILAREDVSVVEPFFDLGGDSMKLVKLRQALEKLAGIEIKVARLFELHTVEAIAAWLDELTGSQMEETEVVSF